MADPVDMIIPLLREMRTENARLHEQTQRLIQALDNRMGAVEDTQGSDRRAMAAAILFNKRRSLAVGFPGARNS
jgi:hypothetical protein